MAETQTKKKTTSKKSAAAAEKARLAEIERRKKTKRIITASVFGFVALLIVIGWFCKDGFAVGGLCRFLKGMTGWGFWLLAPAFILVTYVQGFDYEHSAGWRTTAALITPVLFGAFADLLFAKTAYPTTAGFGEIISTLYAGGKVLSCGGVISGLLSHLCEAAFNVYGAAIILFILLVFFGLSACGITPKSVVDNIKARREERAEYEDDEEAVVAPTVKEKPQKAASEKKKEAPAPQKKRVSAIDIPLDDDEETVLEDEKSEPLVPVRRRKARVEPKIQHTDNVEPVSIEEASAIAGVTPVSLSGNGSTAAGEISDPPKKISSAEVAAETAAITSQIEAGGQSDSYERPPIFLLKKGHSTETNYEEELRTNRDRLESTIKSFGVSANVVGMTHGPTVTRYDLELDQGVKLSRLTNLAGDIALALGVVSVRIAPIPDKISTVGIEVPNKLVSTVYLRDIIDSPKFAKAKSVLSFAIGKDIAGDPVVGNISKLPHLLIAGTTGSGKSVCMNSLIISLLYKSNPDDVKLIMIDPKMVELGIYNGIPHLYIPVVTDPKKAAGALQWAVTEMLKRYRLFSEIGVRTLEAYNEHLEANAQPKIPNVVVVIDELADLMLVASKEVEESICRVAQMGRAAGMHLVIATQRPSADVITGLMKANIPSRIAFAVSSALESRIILDNAGAEKLIGMGDMLYAPLGCGKPLRVQGAFVSDEERDAIVSFIKEQSTANYSEDIMAQIEKAAEDKNANNKSSDPDNGSSEKSDYDELLPQAVDVIFDTKQASVSMLQRRLKLGYSRAARIVDQMEEIGIVGPFEGSKPRQILITRDQWMEMQMLNGTAPTEVLKTQMEFGDDAETIEG